MDGRKAGSNDRAQRYARDTQLYEEWLGKVNAHVTQQLGVGIEDLPDYAYRDAYLAGTDPMDCATTVIEEVSDA